MVVIRNFPLVVRNNEEGGGRTLRGDTPPKYRYKTGTWHTVHVLVYIIGKATISILLPETFKVAHNCQFVCL